MNDLIDTTEMYLRTIFELEEEGIVPLRARIAERLHQSGPTVSQTVARMERDGLLTVEGDRHLQLSEAGRRLARQGVRFHDLSRVFAGHGETLYFDNCCHFNRRGNEVMAQAIAEALLQTPEPPPARTTPEPRSRSPGPGKGGRR